MKKKTLKIAGNRKTGVNFCALFTLPVFNTKTKYTYATFNVDLGQMNILHEIGKKL